MQSLWGMLEHTDYIDYISIVVNIVPSGSGPRAAENVCSVLGITRCVQKAIGDNILHLLQV